jgi:hypothetical protein
VNGAQRRELHRAVVAPVAAIEAHNDRTPKQKTRQRHGPSLGVRKGELRHGRARLESSFEDVGLAQSHLGAMERTEDAGRGISLDGVFESLHLCVQRHG